MPDTGFVLCTTTSVLDTSTVNWSNPGNVTADDGAVASTSPGNGQSSDYLVANGYGFSIPAGATIDGIEVQLDATYSLSQVGVNVYLTLLGTDLDSSGRSGAGGSGLETIGGPTDLWGITPSEAQVEASTFGCLVNVGGGAPSGGTASVDAIWMKVYYTAERGYQRIVGPVQLGTTATTLYTAPEDTLVQIRHIYLNNPSGGSVDARLSIGADAADTRIVERDLAAGQSLNLRRRGEFTMTEGEILQGAASSAATVVVMVDAYLRPL